MLLVYFIQCFDFEWETSFGSLGRGFPHPGGYQDGHLFTWIFGQMISSNLIAVFSVFTLGISNWVKLITPKI